MTDMKERAEQDFGGFGYDPSSDGAWEQGRVKMAGPKSKGRSRAAQIIVWVLLVLLVLLDIVNVGTSNANRKQSDDLADRLTTAYNPSFKVRYGDYGAQVVRAWFNPAITSSPVPLADGIEWPGGGGSSDDATSTDEGDSNTAAATGSEDGSSASSSSSATSTKDSVPISVVSVAFLGGEQTENPTQRGAYAEQDYYSAYINGSFYRVAVTMGIPDLDDFNAEPVLVAPPTIVTVAPQATKETQNPVTPNGWHKFDVKDNLATQLDAFAEAYTENNTVQLKQLTGDGNADHFYAGLTPGSWQYVKDSSSAIWAYEQSSGSGQVVVELQWQMKLPDETIEEGDSTRDLTGQTTTQRMDLLVTKAASGLPSVVAWGPAGTYATLEAKQNALTQDEFNNLPVRTDVETDGSTK